MKKTSSLDLPSSGLSLRCIPIFDRRSQKLPFAKSLGIVELSYQKQILQCYRLLKVLVSCVYEPYNEPLLVTFRDSHTQLPPHALLNERRQIGTRLWTFGICHTSLSTFKRTKRMRLRSQQPQLHQGYNVDIHISRNDSPRPMEHRHIRLLRFARSQSYSGSRTNSASVVQK
ncbi:Uncharacterized protein HZ326_4449 [Fusarium oxysporum f. sp. albedinis]|nr:Uncharacterized protein HZ326_4449 [Fusarium oxysporum f. sp. albedinis]